MTLPPARASWFLAACVVVAGCAPSGAAPADAKASAASVDASATPDASDSSYVARRIEAEPAVPVNGFRIVFFDVGQGDAILVQTGTGETLLVDGGKSDSLLHDRLQRLGVDHIDAIVATHGDADHIGGLLAALEDYDVGTVYWNGSTDKDTSIFKAFFAAVVAEGSTVGVLKRGDRIELGEFHAVVVNPRNPLTGDSNGDSVVLSFGCLGTKVLLTGDAEFGAETDMATAGVLEDIDVLKVAHHGANSATSDAFLATIKPEVGILSVGQKNAYGHPAAATVDRLNHAGVALWTTDVTDQDDSIELVTDCGSPYVVRRVYGVR